MNPLALTRDEVRQILKASNGIPSQVSSARAVGDRLIPASMGHPISSHLHSASLVDGKTKFLSMDDMVEALWLLLRTTAGQAALTKLKVGSRATIKCEVPALFGFECELRDPQGRPMTHKVKFSPSEQRLAGRSRTSCVAVLESRERTGRAYLQVHTFFPEMSSHDASLLLATVRKHQRR